MQPHTYSLSVYYHDVDYLGIVHHSNHVKYLEAARTEWFRTLGLGFIELHEHNIFFAIAHLDIAYKMPAYLDDHLQVVTKLVKLKPASICCQQVIKRIKPSEGIIAEATVRFCTVNRELQPIRVPTVVVEGINRGN